MKSYSIKFLFLSIIFLSLFQNIYLIEDEDLKIEDEIDDNKNDITKKKNPIRNSRFQEDSDEFDDPNLLHSQNMKEKNIKNQYQQQEPIPIKNTNNSEPQYDDENDDYDKKDLIHILLYKYVYEVSMGSFLIIFILNAIYGKSKNKGIAIKWYNKSKDFFIENYAHIGAEREFNPKKSDALIYDSYNEYKFFASGRIYVNWMLVDIVLKRRQDLLSMLSGMFLFPEKDKIMYEAVIVPQYEIPVVFCICKKKNAKTMKKNYSEIDNFTEAISPSFLNENLVMFTENTEFIINIFKQPELLAEYKKIEKYIDTIFFTDRRNSKDNYAIVLSYEGTNIKDDEIYKNFTIFAHMLIDTISVSVIKGGNYKKEAEQRRRDFDAQRSKELAERNQEEIRNKKEEEKNEQRNKPMTREQAQKLEEKERKEALKNKRKKMFKFVKA